MKFSIKDFFSKCDQISSFLRIWSHLLKKFLMENFIFCVVRQTITSVAFTRNFLTWQHLRRNYNFLFSSYFWLGYVIMVNFSCKHKSHFFEIFYYIWAHLQTDHANIPPEHRKYKLTYVTRLEDVLDVF